MWPAHGKHRNFGNVTMLTLSSFKVKYLFLNTLVFGIFWARIFDTSRHVHININFNLVK
jgi:hypothetical protein